MNHKAIEELYKYINTQVFTINQTDTYDEITDKIITLANAVHSFEGDNMDLWSIGEFGESSLDDFIVGAYWHYTEWHDGQSSNSYAALSALGEVFTPNMTMPPEVNEPEFSAYDALNTLAGEELVTGSRSDSDLLS